MIAMKNQIGAKPLEYFNFKKKISLSPIKRFLVT